MGRPKGVEVPDGRSKAEARGPGGERERAEARLKLSGRDRSEPMLGPGLDESQRYEGEPLTLSLPSSATDDRRAAYPASTDTDGPVSDEAASASDARLALV